jgi:hypothetical protein
MSQKSHIRFGMNRWGSDGDGDESKGGVTELAEADSEETHQFVIKVRTFCFFIFRIFLEEMSGSCLLWAYYLKHWSAVDEWKVTLGCVGTLFIGPVVLLLSGGGIIAFIMSKRDQLCLIEIVCVLLSISIFVVKFALLHYIDIFDSPRMIILFIILSVVSFGLAFGILIFSCIPNFKPRNDMENNTDTSPD